MKELPKVFSSDYVRFDDTKMRMVLTDNAPEWAILEYNEYWKQHELQPDDSGNVIT